MTRIYVHSNVPLPQPSIVGHKGIWSFPLGDGTYLIAIGHDDPAEARMQCAAHPCILDIAPSRTSGAAVGTTMTTAVQTFLNNHPNASALQTTVATTTADAPTDTVSTTSTHDLLDQVFNVTGDIAFHPESSL